VKRTVSARRDAGWFADWLTDTLKLIEARDDFNDANDRRITLDYIRNARDRFLAIARKPKSNP